MTDSKADPGSARGFESRSNSGTDSPSDSGNGLGSSAILKHGAVPGYFYSLRDRDLKHSSVSIVEGHTLVRRILQLMESGRELKPLSLLSMNGQEDEYCELFSGICPVHSLSQREISELIGYKFHRGVLAALERPRYHPLEELRPPGPAGVAGAESEGISTDESDGTSDAAVSGRGRELAVSCAYIQEGSNLGAIIRSAAAFDIRDIIIGPLSADPYSRKAVRASAGWVFGVNLYYSDDPPASLPLLKSRGYRLLAAESGERGATALEEYCGSGGGRGPAVLFLGHEFQGLDEAMLWQMDRLLEIPMEGGTDSLNVGVAAGIFLYRLSRPEL